MRSGAPVPERFTRRERSEGPAALPSVFAWVLGVSLLASTLGGCAYIAVARVPIQQRWQPSPLTPQRNLVVFLPGIGDSADEFAEHGFVRLLQARHPEFDAVLVDAFFNYYRNGSVVERLYDDVIAPARKRGYRSIYVVGISLGGLGALALSEQHPDAIQGLLLLSPYLGERDVADEIERAGGLEQWTPSKGNPVGFERWIQNSWLFLKARAKAPDTPPRLLLGYGTEDRFARPLGLLAAALPSDHVRKRPGIHDWNAWTPLYQDLLEQLTGSEPGTPSEVATPRASRTSGAAR
jgi:pimeloyl-ACP methyl ester carboxylesterase